MHVAKSRVQLLQHVNFGCARFWGTCGCKHAPQTCCDPNFAQKGNCYTAQKVVQVAAQRVQLPKHVK